jgi:anti-anti-sigma factor
VIRMEISKDKKGMIVFKGNLVVSTIENAHSSLKPLLEDSPQNVTIDLSEVEEIDIAGLQLLASLKKTFEEEGFIHVTSLNAGVKEYIMISGFDLALKEALHDQ